MAVKRLPKGRLVVLVAIHPSRGDEEIIGRQALPPLRRTVLDIIGDNPTLTLLSHTDLDPVFYKAAV
jgi:hypothetical protein